MDTSHCQLCDRPLVDASDLAASNKSKEHIIPNAIGGRRKLHDFICQACNSQTGDAWDSVLISQLNFLCLFIGIVRERGNVNPMRIDSSDGRVLVLREDGTQTLAHPHYEVRETEAGLALNIQAKSTKEAKNLLQKAKKKYPQIDVEAGMQQMKFTDDYAPRVLKTTIEFGGGQSGRSLVKSCVALAFSKGIPAARCELAMAYLNHADGFPSFGYYYETDLILNRPTGSIFHCVAVVGDPVSKMLLGYVEYFSAHRMVVCLSEEYEGEPISEVYAIDPRSGEELDLSIQLAFSREELQSIYRYEKMTTEAMKAAMDPVIAAGYLASQKRVEKKVVDDALAHAFNNYGAEEGKPMTKENIGRISRLAAEKISLFHLQRLQQRSNDEGEEIE